MILVVNYFILFDLNGPVHNQDCTHPRLRATKNLRNQECAHPRVCATTRVARSPARAMRQSDGVSLWAMTPGDDI